MTKTINLSAARVAIPEASIGDSVDGHRVVPDESTVPWPQVDAYSGGAASGGVAAWLKVRLGNGPETTEFIRKDLTPSPADRAASVGAVSLTDQQCAAQLALMKSPPMKDGEALHDWAMDVMRAGHRLAALATPQASPTPQSAAQGLEAIGWQFRFVFPTHASNWKSVLELPMSEMKGGDGFKYETRLVYAATPQPVEVPKGSAGGKPDQ